MPDAEIDKLAYECVVEDLLRQINMGRSFEQLFDSIYHRLRGIVPYDRMGVALLDDRARTMELVACRSDGPTRLDVGYSAPVEGSTLETLLQTGQPRIINDLARYLADKPDSLSTRLIVEEGMRSSLTLPLLADGKAIGVVFFSSRQTDAFNRPHADLLKRLAGHIALSVEKMRLIDALEKQNRELVEANALKQQFLDKLRLEVDRQTEELRNSECHYRSLVNLGRIINANLDIREVFRRASVEIDKLMGCDRVSLLLVDADHQVRYGLATEFSAQGARDVEVPARNLSNTAAAWVMQHRMPRIARSLEDSREFPEDHRLYDQGYRAYVYLPLVCREQSVGILGLAARREKKLDGWDMKLLGDFTSLLATALDNASAYTQIAELKAQLEQENVYLRDEIKTEHDFANIIGSSRPMAEIRRSVRQVAESESTVLIEGETGTGKELLARAVHDLSPRRDKLLVKVNCAALSQNLITSELFGHEPGAFTGATARRQGRFELAHHGTIFLDEIAEIPPETQVMLLRVLQEKVIERVGGTEPIEVDVRVVAATNVTLADAVAAGRFRSDLFYRLNVFPIRVPPLRERREDIPALMNHFIGRFSVRMKKPLTRVSRRTMELLMSYRWPGNVRELENILERAMIVTTSDTLEIDPTWLSGVGTDVAPDEQMTFGQVERRTILDALQRTGGKIYGPGGAAGLLGLKPSTLYGKMRKFGIRRDRSWGQLY
jgi:formate hydrogenlyase transcriptional activator